MRSLSRDDHLAVLTRIGRLTMRLQLTAILFASACTLNGDPIDTNGEGGSTTDASASGSATNALTDGMTSTSGMTNASTSGTSDGSDDQNGSSDGQGTGNEGFVTTAESSSGESGNVATETSGGSSSDGGSTGGACGVLSESCDNTAPCCEGFACIGGSCVACVAEGDPCDPNGGEPCCGGLTCVGGALGMAAMCS